MTNKEKYISEVEEQISGWRHDIFTFRVIAEAEEEEPDRQITEYRIIEDLVDREQSVSAKLEELRQDDAADWHVLRQQIDVLCRQVTEAIDVARKKVN